MNKGDLVVKISQDCEITKATAEKALVSVLEASYKKYLDK